MSDFQISKSAAEEFLSQREGSAARISEYKKLGSGWHGSGYSISYSVNGREKRVVLRTLSPVSFSHDHPSDRASVFVLQNEMFNIIPKHVRSIDVGGLSPGGRLVSLGDAREFFQIVEVADGEPYMKDIERIEREGKLGKDDMDRVKALAAYLAKLHSSRFSGPREAERSVRLRHLRDAVGHGEMLMGVLDTYPEKISWASRDELAELVGSAVKFSFKVKDESIPLSRIHGDFHPGNIWFDKGGDFSLLDASREPWGLAADDLTALSVNFLWFAVRMTGGFDGPFRDLFLEFWRNYLKMTGDRHSERLSPLFFAFRAVVVAHPIFYPGQGDDVRRRLFSFIRRSLGSENFSVEKINSCLEG